MASAGAPAGIAVHSVNFPAPGDQFRWDSAGLDDHPASRQADLAAMGMSAEEIIHPCCLGLLIVAWSVGEEHLDLIFGDPFERAGNIIRLKEVAVVDSPEGEGHVVAGDGDRLIEQESNAEFFQGVNEVKGVVVSQNCENGWLKTGKEIFDQFHHLEVIRGIAVLKIAGDHHQIIGDPTQPFADVADQFPVEVDMEIA